MASENEQAGKKFFVNVEGTEYPWDSETITVAQIRQLPDPDIPTDQQLVEEFADGSEKTLSNSDVITLKPGHRYGRAPKYKRG
jgi:hypothetical protein